MVEIKIFVNHIDHTNKILLESGFTHKETITQELESKACVFLVKEEDKELIQVDDLIAIQRKVNNDFVDTDYFLVGAIESSLFTKQEPYYWKKTTILVELTKELERIPLPPCSFTNPNDDLLTIFNKALDKAFVRRGNQPSKFVLTGRLETLLRDQAGEDFIYNQPTILRNILDDILLVKNARIKVSRVFQLGVLGLDYKPLSFENRPVEDIDLLKHPNIKDLKIIGSLNGKAREYETYTENLISQTPIEDSWRVFKPKELDLVTTENEYYCFDKPIEYLVSFEVMCKMRLYFYDELPPINPNTIWNPIYIEDRFIVVDLINDIVEKEIYNIKSLDEQDFLLFYEKQSTSMNLLRRRGIFNSSILQGRIAWRLKKLWENWNADPDFLGQYKYVRAEPFNLDNELDTSGAASIWTKWQWCVFRAKYNAYLDQHYSFTKDEKNKGTILIAPSESLIDSKRYADKVYNTTQSQGNLRLECDFTFDNLDQDKDIYKNLKVGNRIRFNNKTFTITSKEKSFNKEHIKDHLVLDENYMPELPEKVSRERQLFKNPIDKYVTRDILIKDKVRFNLSTSVYYLQNLFKIEHISKLMEDTFITKKEPIKLNAFLTANSKHFIFNTNPIKLKNSIIYNFGFFDNYSAGLTKGESTLGGYTINFNSYVDNTGEVDIVRLQMLTDTYNNTANHSNFNLGALIEHLATLPAPTLTDLLNYYNYESNSLYLKIRKDRLEHITFTYQLEFLSSEEVIIGPEFINVFNLVGKATRDFQIYASTTESYKEGAKYVVGERQNTAQIIKNSNNAFLEIVGFDLTKYKSFGIGLGGKDLVLGFNNNFENKGVLKY